MMQIVERTETLAIEAGNRTRIIINNCDKVIVSCLMDLKVKAVLQWLASREWMFFSRAYTADSTREKTAPNLPASVTHYQYNLPFILIELPISQVIGTQKIKVN